jgi:uncharacterized protein (TIGR01244 family)
LEALMRTVKVNGKLAVAKQLQIAEFATLARQGFTAVINNRQDGEHAAQPGSKAEAAAAQAAGLAYIHIPVTADQICDTDIRRFQEAGAHAPGPVLAHCSTGRRSLALWVLGEVLDGRLRRELVRALGVTLGYDLAPAEAWLAKHEPQQHRRLNGDAPPIVEGFFDQRTSSVQYVVSDPKTRTCAIIDPVLDFEEKSGSTATSSADAILAHIERQGLSVAWILDTHLHADHLSAAHYLKAKTGAPMGIGAEAVEVQKIWRDIYNLPDLPTDGSQWDKLFTNGEHFKVGGIDAGVLFSPGHTPASVTYVIGDAAFVHDTLFMPDGGTARADFPGGDARELWRSIQALLVLPKETRVFPGHDYQPGGRKPRWQSTIAEQKRANIHVAGKTEAEFVAKREDLDRTLPMPKLLLHALQVNIRGGRLPEPEDNGRRYLKLPLDAFQGAAWGEP